LPGGGADTEDEQLQAEGATMEQATILSAIKSAAVQSDTFLKLEPLTKVAQQAYVLQVLRAKYSYSGTLDGIPSGLLDFVFARSGGKPVFIETVRLSATDCHCLRPSSRRCACHPSPPIALSLSSSASPMASQLLFLTSRR
jgi:hypothetical protein